MRCLRLILVIVFSLLTSNQVMGELPTDVEAILAKHCIKCHGQKKQLGKLDLRTLESIRIGGKRGPAITAADAKASRIVQLIQPGAKPHMPPGKKQLTEAEIATISDWIHGLSAEPAGPLDPLDREELAEVVDSETPQSADSKFSPDTDPSNAIDGFVAKRYEELGVTPAERCSDATFVRRIYLDLLGRLPTLEESREFLNADSDRSKLIGELLANEEFPQHWAKLFDAMLMGRKERKLSDRKRHGWHAYLESVFRERKPWDEVAREVLLARGGAEGKPKQRGHLWFLYERDNKHQDIAEAIARGFFGVDIACAQCHDHPLAGEIEQAHYWGLVGFFKRTSNTKSEHGIALAESAIGGFDSYANALTGSTDESILTFLDRQPVAETRPEKPDKQEDKDEFYTNVEKEPRVPKFSRRQEFVDKILKDHPLLARAMVNRVWAILLGRGLVHPVDEMDSQHTASHPELLDWLAQDFANHTHDIPRLVEAITKSRTYQLDSVRPTAANGLPVESSTFAYGLEKPLPAEAAIRALQTALQLTDEELNTDDLGKEFRKLFPDIVPDNQLTTLKQTMMLSNHPKLREVYLRAAENLLQAEGNGKAVANDEVPNDEVPNEEVSKVPNDNVSNAKPGLLQNDPRSDEFLQSLYERHFVRRADEDELNAVRSYLQARTSRMQTALADVLWAMTTSAEFRFNH